MQESWQRLELQNIINNDKMLVLIAFKVIYLDRKLECRFFKVTFVWKSFI